MNKITLSLIVLVLISGSYFGYNYYKKMILPKESEITQNTTNPIKELDKPFLTDPIKEVVDPKILVQKEITDLIAKEKLNFGGFTYPLYIKEEKQVAIISALPEGGSPSECIISKQSTGWKKIGCHQNLLPCEMLDEAGMDRDSTIKLKCFDYKSQSYRIK